MAMNSLECLLNEPTRVTTETETCIDHVVVRVRCKYIMQLDVPVLHAGITDHPIVCLRLELGGGEEGQDVYGTSNQA